MDELSARRGTDKAASVRPTDPADPTRRVDQTGSARRAGQGSRPTGQAVRRTDQTAVRRTNLAAVLGALRSGPSTRTRLAAELGLTKATVSSIVGELAERGLARTHEPTRAGAIGRPGQQVELTPERAVGLGIEINVDYLAVRAIDVSGAVVAEARESLDVAALAPSAAIQRGLELAERTVGAVVAQPESDRGSLLAGVGVAVPGLVEQETGIAPVVPNLGWSRTPVRKLVEHANPWPYAPVTVDNEANLATLGESRLARPETADLLYITGDIGVGGGVLSGGLLLRGAAGFAGEVGHLTIDPNGRRCGCGRRGCWETLCGLSALLDAAADPSDPVHDPSRDVDERIALLAARAVAGDERTTAALDQVGHQLGLGAAMLVNVVNPAVLVLGGYFASLGEYVLEPVRAELAARVVAPHHGGCQVELSRLGLFAAATGAAYAVLEPVLDDPTLVPIPWAIQQSNGSEVAE